MAIGCLLVLGDNLAHSQPCLHGVALDKARHAGWRECLRLETGSFLAWSLCWSKTWVFKSGALQ